MSAVPPRSLAVDRGLAVERGSTVGGRPRRATYDVLVVGAGPGGLTTAAALARFGVRVLVVDRHAATSIFPRATGVSTRTMEVMRTWGLEERVRAGEMPLRPFVSMSRRLGDRDLVEVPIGFSPPTEDAARLSPTAACFCPQDHLEPVLLGDVRAHGGRVRFDTELTGFAMDEDGVTATLRDRAGVESSVCARFLVGADGPRSSVRTGLGIDVEDLGHLGEWVSVLFRADLSGVVGDRRYVLHAVGTREEPSLFVPTGNDDRWQYAWQWDPGRHPERGETVEHWTPDTCADVIRDAVGVPDLPLEIHAVLPFTMGGTVATRFRAGNAFLIGDAAHRMTPRGGRGLNTAVGDGYNLGWKLAWVLRGWAGDALLDSYEPERRPVGVANTLHSLDTSERDASRVLADALAADLGVVYRSAVVADDGVPAGSPAPGAADEPWLTARPGARAPHAWVTRAGRLISTLDLFDGRLTVLTAHGGHRWRRAAAELAATGLPLATVTVGREVRDVDGALADRYGIGAGGAMLVRPDGHVAWRQADAASDARTVLAAAVAKALGRPVVAVEDGEDAEDVG